MQALRLWTIWRTHILSISHITEKLHVKAPMKTRQCIKLSFAHTMECNAMQCNGIPSANLALIQERTHFLCVQKFFATLSNCARPLKGASPFLHCYCQISTRDALHWSTMKRRHSDFQSRSSKQPCHMVQICSVYCSCFILEAMYFQQDKCNSLFFDSVVIKPTTRTRHTYAHQRANLSHNI